MRVDCSKLQVERLATHDDGLYKKIHCEAIILHGSDNLKVTYHYLQHSQVLGALKCVPSTDQWRA